MSLSLSRLNPVVTSVTGSEGAVREGGKHDGAVHANTGNRRVSDGGATPIRRCWRPANWPMSRC